MKMSRNVKQGEIFTTESIVFSADKPIVSDVIDALNANQGLITSDLISYIKSQLKKLRDDSHSDCMILLKARDLSRHDLPVSKGMAFGEKSQRILNSSDTGRMNLEIYNNSRLALKKIVNCRNQKFSTEMRVGSAFLAGTHYTMAVALQQEVTTLQGRKMDQKSASRKSRKVRKSKKNPFKEEVLKAWRIYSSQMKACSFESFKVWLISRVHDYYMTFEEVDGLDGDIFRFYNQDGQVVDDKKWRTLRRWISDS